MASEIINKNEQDLLDKLSKLIEYSKQKISSQANSALTMLF